MRQYRGADCPYLLLTIHDSRLRVGVPVHSAEQVGLREVLRGKRLEELLHVLRDATGFEERQWSRRMKDHHEKLVSGDLHRVAEVVRDLIHRRDRRGLSPSEASMLKDAREPLIGELSLALGLDPGTAAEHLEALCRSGRTSRRHEAGAPERLLRPAG